MKGVLTSQKLNHFRGNSAMSQGKTSPPIHVPNQLLSPEKRDRHVLLLFYSFRDEKENR